MRLMRAALTLLFPTILACSGGAQSAAGRLRPSDVAEYTELPAGYTLGERLSERCSPPLEKRALRDERLVDVDCSQKRLSAMLRARAAERGVAVLVHKSCQRDGSKNQGLRCSASLTEASGRVPLGDGAAAAPLSAAQVRDLDEPRPHDSRRIRVSFIADAAARALPPRPYDTVAETAVASVGRRNVGQVSARCERCDDMALRHALRVTAGRMGAGEVAAVRCFTDDERRCVGTALEPWSF